MHDLLIEFSFSFESLWRQWRLVGVDVENTVSVTASFTFLFAPVNFVPNMCERGGADACSTGEHNMHVQFLSNPPLPCYKTTLTVTQRSNGEKWDAELRHHVQPLPPSDANETKFRSVQKLVFYALSASAVISVKFRTECKIRSVLWSQALILSLCLPSTGHKNNMT